VNTQLTLRVTRLRSQNPRGQGGAIFTGLQIDCTGNVQDAAGYLVVRASNRVLAGVSVEQGQWWDVAGNLRSHAVEVNGYRMIERQVEATSATLVRPSGEHIVTLLAENPTFEGIGQVKARKLWEAFGEQLYEILDEADVETLSTQLTPEIARKVTRAWSMYGDAKTLKWLQTHGFDVAVGKKVVEFFGAETSARIEEDPYRLLSFCATWRQVDDLARGKLALAVDDPRRLRGAIEEACYRLFAAGHTLVQRPTLKSTVGNILGSRISSLNWGDLTDKALDHGLSNGSYVAVPEGIQPLGAMAMESVVAGAFAERIRRGDRERLLSPDTVDRLITDHEATEGLVLNIEQRAAIHTACSHSFACIIGGAGVGKTTVLKALYRIYDQADVRVIQLALAGRAAKRMQEATGRDASTIASFLHSPKEGDLTIPCVLVVDEASMVDIIAMSRICEVMAPHARILLVGDPSQLMPVGPGLVLHAVAAVPDVPLVELKVVKRYGDEIRRAGELIRGGQWPTLSRDESAAITFRPCEMEESRIADVIVALYMQDPQETQILCSRRNGLGGANSLNSACQSRISCQSQALMVWNDTHDCRDHAGLYLGDVVLCTRNLWERGLQNGSLGTVVQIERERRFEVDEEGNSAGRTLAWVEWDDGVLRPLQEDMLDDVVLGYAITVHKAQGSQWPRVIVSVAGDRFLDRTLLYTAITRAQERVILVGDESLAQLAVRRPPRSLTRQTGLGSAIRRTLSSAAINRQ
jgi:exodeoxyribonuclease V alpha subunit